MHNPFRFNIVSTQKLTSKEIKEKKIIQLNVSIFLYLLISTMCGAGITILRTNMNSY